MLENLEKLVTEIEEAGIYYVELRAIARRYEELKKIKLAQLKRDHAKRNDGRISHVQLESKAYADPDYKKFILDLVRTEKESEKAKVRYEACKNLFDAMRTNIAFEREKLAKGVIGVGR